MSKQGVKDWRTRTKFRLIEYKGGKCEICGYDKPCFAAFCFHHINPAEKEFQISSKTLAYDNLIQEVDKCQLLCVRCHAEIHEAERNKSGYKMFIRNQRPILKKTCLMCGKDFDTKVSSQRYCSNGCVYAARRKLNCGPEEMSALIEKHKTNIAIAKLFGVSDKTIGKFRKLHKI